MMACPLCNPGLEIVLWRDEQCRVILAGSAEHPAFCRVVWHAHVCEMTDLPPGRRASFMNVVWAVEAAQRELLRPRKINLASLGNQVPHLHWHVIPRFEDDAHFPDSVWSPSRRAGVPHEVDAARLAALLTDLLQQSLGQGRPDLEL